MFWTLSPQPKQHSHRHIWSDDCPYSSAVTSVLTQRAMQSFQSQSWHFNTAALQCAQQARSFFPSLIFSIWPNFSKQTTFQAQVMKKDLFDLSWQSHFCILFLTHIKCKRSQPSFFSLRVFKLNLNLIRCYTLSVKVLSLYFPGPGIQGSHVCVCGHENPSLFLLFTYLFCPHHSGFW